MADSPNPTLSQILSGKVVEGHRVASGQNADPKFPGGTLAMQLPHFQERGLDLSDYHLATLNLSVAPLTIDCVWQNSLATFRDVRWHPTEPAEDFSFFPVAIRRQGEGDTSWIDGLIYYPHPDTKPAHFQPEGMIEILAERFLASLGYGDRIELAVNPKQVHVSDHSQP